jgi:hypothetical protein
MSIESDAAFIMDRINLYDEVQTELYKIKDGNSKLSLNEWNEWIEIFKK